MADKAHKRVRAQTIKKNHQYGKYDANGKPGDIVFGVQNKLVEAIAEGPDITFRYHHVQATKSNEDILSRASNANSMEWRRALWSWNGMEIIYSSGARLFWK